MYSRYPNYRTPTRRKSSRRWWLPIIVIAAAVIAIFGWRYLDLGMSVEERIDAYLRFENVTEAEKQKITDYIIENDVKLSSELIVSAQLNETLSSNQKLLETYVPVTHFNSVAQNTAGLSTDNYGVLSTTDAVIVTLLAEKLQLQPDAMKKFEDVSEIDDESVAVIPLSQLDKTIKLLAVGDNYYLDALNQGAFFLQLEFAGDNASELEALSLSNPLQEDELLTVKMTGVTALTREMQRRLAQGTDPLFFSEKIGDFLADADITHVSNEVSFLENCEYSSTLFCSPPEFIETLKASGVDLVEVTGNHNNDRGREANAATLQQYKELGWSYVGGGLNTEDARQPYVTDQKGSKVTILAYNYPDSPNGGAIASSTGAGANVWDIDNITSDIAAAKASSNVVIVNVQFWECYAYPDGYVEFPQCDYPTGEQEPIFKNLIDLGADMVVGTSAHQPQTYELYEGKPIYYGLGNMYFDQSYWPGTERGIVLTHYFNEGKLLQTKLTPTVYKDDLQPRLMTDEETVYLLQRLADAR